MEVVAVILVVGALLYVYHTDQLKTKDLRIHARDEKIIDVTSELKSKFIAHEKNFILAKDIAESLADKLQNEHPSEFVSFKPRFDNISKINIRRVVLTTTKINIDFL